MNLLSKALRKGTQAQRSATLYHHLCSRMLPIKLISELVKTMMVAQQLYEGINIGSGVQGLITYMRTDSTRISPVAQTKLQPYYRPFW